VSETLPDKIIPAVERVVFIMARGVERLAAHVTAQTRGMPKLTSHVQHRAVKYGRRTFNTHRRTCRRRILMFNGCLFSNSFFFILIHVHILHEKGMFYNTLYINYFKYVSYMKKHIV